MTIPYRHDSKWSLGSGIEVWIFNGFAMLFFEYFHIYWHWLYFRYVPSNTWTVHGTKVSCAFMNIPFENWHLTVHRWMPWEWLRFISSSDGYLKTAMDGFDRQWVSINFIWVRRLSKFYFSQFSNNLKSEIGWIQEVTIRSFVFFLYFYGLE